MNAASTAYVTCTIGNKKYTYHFTGVNSIEHNLALNLDNTSSQGIKSSAIIGLYRLQILMNPAYESNVTVIGLCYIQKAAPI